MDCALPVDGWRKSAFPRPGAPTLHPARTRRWRPGSPSYDCRVRVIDLRDSDLDNLDAVLPRPELDIGAALKAVEPIIDQVHHQGAAALRELSQRFDGVVPETIRVPREALRAALAEQPKALTEALQVAIDNATAAHRAQLPSQVVTEIVPGGFVYQRWVPLSRVGLYVPGGLAVYPSSVVMNVVAAQVAGVDSLVVASPPQKEFGGLPHPSILAACAMLGVEEVIAVGGAQAIAAMAYGFTDGDYTCRPVDKVTGPGNIYVAAAKRAIQGVCGIDSEAGTTEIAVLADDTANADYVAADLISQAEHDPAAASVLVTDSRDLADRVQAALERQVPGALHHERIAQALNGPQSGIVLTRDIEAATRVIESYGPEHLEVVTKDALERSLLIRNAGAIFVGDYSPVPLGDYVGGSNHVLPTGGTSRYSSGLNTTVYLRSVQVIDYDQDALALLTPSLEVLAQTEGLPSHGRAAALRQDRSAASLPGSANQGEGTAPDAARGPAPVPGRGGTADLAGTEDALGSVRSERPLGEGVRANLALPVREDLRSIEPYGAPQLDVPVRLNVNENPHAPSDRVVDSIADAVRGAAKRLNRYADRDALALRAELARYVSAESGVTVVPDQVWAANGSNEVMLQLLQAFGGPGRVALAEAPTYSMYSEYARDTFTEFRQVPAPGHGFSADVLIDAMRKWRPAVVFIPSPNNPTGTAVSLAELRAVLDASGSTGPVRSIPLEDAGPSRPVPSSGPRATIVVVDEAYVEFRDPGQASALELLAGHPNLVVTRTMSKAFAAAGLRLGYMVTSPVIIAEVMKVRLPYHLSLVTQAAATAALGAAQAQLDQVGAIRERREALAGELRDLGFLVEPSSANFLLFGRFPDRHAVWQKLLDQGVLIREVGPPGYLRVTVGTDRENARFLEALKGAV